MKDMRPLRRWLRNIIPLVLRWFNRSHTVQAVKVPIQLPVAETKCPGIASSARRRAQQQQPKRPVGCTRSRSSHWPAAILSRQAQCYVTNVTPQIEPVAEVIGALWGARGRRRQPAAAKQLARAAAAAIAVSIAAGSCSSCSSAGDGFLAQGC